MIAFCDKIAAVCQDGLVHEVTDYAGDGIINRVGPIKSDLDPIGGWFVSPKKTISVTDMNGKHYKITVEEV